VTESPHPLVRDLLPALVAEVEASLRDIDEDDLADQAQTLEIWGRCSCGDDFCSSFYTGPRARGQWSDEGEHRTVPLIVGSGMVNLDVVASVIRYVEVLYRLDVDAIVREQPALPKDPPSTVA
jgi:hypothetical protein